MKSSLNTVNSLTISALSLATLTFTSCSEKPEEKESAYENTDEKQASPIAEVAEKNTEAMDNLATKLEGINDLESAKAALPDLAKSGAKFAKLKFETFKAGGPEKLQKFLADNPDALTKYSESVEKVKVKMEQLKEEHPAAEAMIRDYIETLFK